MSYPSNSDSVAQDQIKAFVDRILRMKAEAKAINADVREIYAEAKAVGFDKTVLGKLVNYVEKREANSAAVMESESIFDLYLTAYDSAKNHPHAHARERAAKSTTPNPSISGALSEENDDEGTTPTTPPHPTKADGSDLAASPANDDGQVADIQPETANEDEVLAAEGMRPGDELENSAASATVDAQEDVAGSQSSEPAAHMYAEPGVVTWESCPPEPVARHKWSEAFGDLGQDIEVITEDLQQARAAPIVKMGNRILDGWARYTKARELGLEYPVVQYDGIDDMVDCIKWNVAGRILTNQHKQIIAARLIKIYPQRKGIILAVLAGEDIGV